MKKNRALKLFLSIILIFSYSFTGIIPAFSTKVFAAEQVEFKVGNIYCGFKLTEEKILPNNSGEARVFVHEKSGARLFQLKNEDENKMFSIGFRTPSKNDKGTAHILEHCVLVGGSEKYPIKQLFKELLQVSITKDLNGFTAPDMTVYPFSTTNEKEFNNLMDVYLNMVFKPRLYEDERIFKEEAWHYELNKESDPIKYNGVVYNEMKGSLSALNSKLYNSIMQSLYPDTNYQYVSGGVPSEIPKLSFEELKDFHKEYYHPSNSYIFIYGNTDITSKLEALNNNYLKDYDKSEVNSQVQKQEPFESQRENQYEYIVDEKEDIKNKSVLSANYAIGTSDNEELTTAFNLINYILFNNPSSPVIKNLNKAGISNVSGVFSTGQYQPFLSIIATNASEEEKDLYKWVIEDSLKDIVQNGIDKEIIKTTINRLELDVRENSGYSSKTGASYNLSILNQWIYDADPMNIFDSQQIIKCLNDSLEGNYLEGIIDKYILKNNHSTLNVMSPVHESTRSHNDEELVLKEYKESLSKKEIAKLIKDNEELREWQNESESKENLDKIPKVTLNDLNPVVEKTPLKVEQYKGTKILHHPMNTNGVISTNFYFDSSKVHEEQIPYVQLLSDLMGNVGSEEYSINELQKLEQQLSKGISYSAMNFISKDDSNKYTNKFSVSTVVLEKNIDKILKLIAYNIQNSNYSNKSVIKQNLYAIKCNLDNIFSDNPEELAINRNLAYFSQGRAYNENLKGVSYKNFIDNLYENFDQDYEKIIKNIQDVAYRVFNENDLAISVTCDDNAYKTFKKSVNNVLDVLSTDIIESKNYDLQYDSKNEAIPIASRVQYNCQGFNFKKHGYEYNGSMVVMLNMLDLDYLWKNLRVTGGAYGYRIINDRNGDIAIASYRDPRVERTYDVYAGISEYLSKLDISEEEFEKYKISCLYKYYHPLTIYQKVAIADRDYFMGVSEEDRIEELNQILNATIDEIKAYSEMFKKGMDENNKTTVGEKKEIEKSKHLFEKIILLTFK